MPSLQQQPRRRTRVVILEDHHLFAESLEVALSIDGYDVRRVGVNDVSSAAAMRPGRAGRSSAHACARMRTGSIPR